MLKQMEVFVKVVENKNFSTAAEQLYMSQPAVSQYIKKMEDFFDICLIQRKNKYIHLTEAGEVVYHNSKKFLEQYSNMLQQIDVLKEGLTGEIKIGASYTFGEYLLPSMIAQLNETYPNLKINVSIDNSRKITQYVENSEIDIGIVEYLYKKNCIEFELLCEDEMIIVVHPKHTKSIFDELILEKSTWITREPGSGTRNACFHLHDKIGINPNIIYMNTTQTIKESIKEDIGIALLSSHVVKNEIEKNTLSILETPYTPYNREFNIVWNKKYTNSNRINTIKKTLIAYCQKLSKY
ncbi:TPA: LysR substrate-binding domain-containing protein [Staphylococcus pseudintermedius]